MIAAYAEVPGPIHLGRRMKFNAKLVGSTGTLYNPVDPFRLELKFMRPPRCSVPAISAEAAARACSLFPWIGLREGEREHRLSLKAASPVHSKPRRGPVSAKRHRGHDPRSGEVRH